MVTTKRYEYMPLEKIGIHPFLSNHRPLDLQKVGHYESDIMKNGLLEPLVVWEKNNDEYYLVGGFHRMASIERIRDKNPGYFERVDVRVVAGDPDEMRALNLKLNADRLDARVSDYFDTVIYLNNANWSKERIADFLDKSVSWIEEIIRYVPGMDQRLRKLIEDDRVSWNKAKTVCRAVRDAPVGQEKDVLNHHLERLTRPREKSKKKSKTKPLTFRSAKSRLSALVKKTPRPFYYVDAEDLYSLVLVLEGTEFRDAHTARVRQSFPGLLD